MQRSAGNAAVNALLAGRWRSRGEEARTDIDAALREMPRDEPAIDTVEKGLKPAKAAGVPVELEGPKPHTTLQPRLADFLCKHAETDAERATVYPSSRVADRHEANAVTLGKTVHLSSALSARQTSEQQRVLAHEAVHLAQQLARQEPGVQDDA